MKPTLIKVLVVAAVTFGSAGCELKFDPEAGHHFSCDPDSDAPGQCPGEYSKCGLDGFCRAPNARGDWLCATNEDCPELEGELWTCGYFNGFDNPQRCYDRAAHPKAMACRYDAGVQDCHPEWKCGLDNRCHDKTPAAYQCASDWDCEGGWRCGEDGVCHDTRNAALQPPNVVRKLIVERANPQLPQEPIDFAVYVPYDNDLAVWRDYAAVHDGGLTYVEFRPAGYVQADGGVSFAARVDVAMTPAPEAVVLSYPIGYNDWSPHVISGGRLRDYAAVVDGRGKATNLGEVPQGASLRALAEGSVFDGHELLFSFKGDQFATYVPYLGYSTPPQPLWDGGTAVEIRDVIDTSETPYAVCNSQTCGPPLIATTSAGLFYAPRSNLGWIGLDGTTSLGPAFRPVQHQALANAACGAEHSNLGRVRYYDGSTFNLFGLEVEGAGSQVKLALQPNGVVPPEMTCGSFALTSVTTCSACPEGARLDEFHLQYTYDDNDVAHPSTVSRCAVPLADNAYTFEAWEALHLPEGQCLLRKRDALIPQVELQPADMSGYSFEFVDRAGTPFGNCFTGSSEECVPMLVGHPTQVAFDVGHRAIIGMDPAVLADGGYTTQMSILEPGVGMVPILREDLCLSEDQFVTGIRGLPEFFLARDLTTGSLEVRHASDFELVPDPFTSTPCVYQPSVALLESSASVELDWPQRVPVFARADTLEDGSIRLIVAAGERVWAETLPAESFEGSGPRAVLPVRIVPLPFSRIESVAILDQPDDARSVVSGYLLANKRLFRISALNSERFDSKEIDLLDELVSVFSDGKRGRVGTRSGTVYSLPIPVPIAEGPLAPDDTVAHAFASVCGDTFAAGAKGLYRLELGDGPVGTWQKVDVSQRVPGADPVLSSFAGAKFHETESGTYLFLKHGIVLRLSYEGC